MMRSRRAANNTPRLRWLGLAAGLLLMRIAAPQWLWVVLAGLFGIWTWRLATRVLTDRLAIRIVMAGYLLKLVLALMLFAISLWHLPVLTGLQSGGGFWQFSGDAAYYHDAARQVLEAWQTDTPTSRFFWERRFIVWMSLLYGVMGAHPLNAILVNVWVGGLIPLLGVWVLQLFASKRGMQRFCIGLLAAWPSLTLWSTQLLKDPLVIAGLLVLLRILGQMGLWLTSRNAAQPVGNMVKSVVVLLLSLVGVASLRTYPIPLVFGAFGMALMLWWIRSVLVDKGRVRITIVRGWSVVAVLVVLIGSLFIGFSISALDLVGLSVPAPSWQLWNDFGRLAQHRTTIEALSRIERLVVNRNPGVPLPDTDVLIRRVVDEVEGRAKQRNEPFQPVELPIMQEAAKTLVGSPEVFAKSLAASRLRMQLRSLTQNFWVTAIQPYVLLSFEGLDDRRRGYAWSGSPMVIDTKTDVRTFGRFVGYLPSAVRNALLAPFPSQWSRGQGWQLFVPEMVGLYLLCPLLLLAWIGLLRHGVSGWFLATYLALTMVFFGSVFINAGILFRARLMFLVPWFAILPLAWTPHDATSSS